MSKSNIDWCDWSWNPITGCYHDCTYCYARKMAIRFAADFRQNINDDRCIKIPSDKNTPLYVLEKPFISRNDRALASPFGFYCTFHKYRLNDISSLKAGRNIFVGSMSDVFGDWVPDEWIKEILDVCNDNPQHNYLFLTKNPNRYWELEDKELLPSTKNIWYGFSYTNNKSKSWASKYGDKNSFISVEPLLEDLRLFDDSMLCPAANWVIIGAETGNRKGKVIPKLEWIRKIVAHCDKFNIPVFMKDSLITIVGEENMRREFPEELKETRISGKRKEILYTHCGICKQENRKSNMTAILGRQARGQSPYAIGYVCNSCYDDFVKGFELDNEDDGKRSESIRDTSSGSKKEST